MANIPPERRRRGAGRRPRRAFAALVGLFAIIGGACGNGDPELPPAIDRSATIRIAAFAGPETSALFRIIPEWEHITGNRVELGIIQPDGNRAPATNYVAYRDAIMENAEVRAGNYDVIIVDDPWMPFLAGNSHLTPLSPFGWESDPDIVDRSAALGVWPPTFGPLPPDQAGVQRGSQNYAIPLVGNVMMLWYRADIIEPPETIDELTHGLANPDPAYVGAAGLAPSNNPHIFLTWLASRGGDIFDREWRPRPLTSNIAVDAMAEYLREATRLRVPLDEYRGERFSPHTRMLDGTASASVAWAADAQQLLTSSVSDQLRVAEFPVGRRSSTLTGNWLLAIPAEAANPEVAFDFITWATSREIMKTSALLGVPPVRRSLFSDRELIALYSWLPDVEAALVNSFARPRIPAWDLVEGILSCALDRGLLRAQGIDTTSEGALDEYVQIAQEILLSAATDIERVMREWGYYEGAAYWNPDQGRRIPGDPRLEWQCAMVVS